MEPQIRRLEPGEESEFVRSVRVPFLDPETDREEGRDALERLVRRVETPRAWVAVEDGRFVANSGVKTMDVTVPAAPGQPCPVIPMGGVTAVGVHPTHRRRGLLGRLMANMIDDCRRRGEGVAGLIASESVIYGRFGFGLATEWATLEIDTREAALLVAPPPLELRLLRRDEAAAVLPALFERLRRARPGEPGRSEGFWEEVLADDPHLRPEGNGAFHAACDDGYVSYRAVEDPSPWRRDRIVVEDLRASSPDAEAALWRYVFDIDLADRVTARRRPVDEPLRWRLADPRQLRVAEIEDRLHLRVLDVVAAFGARGYQSAGRLVLDVGPARSGDGTDPAVGRWVIEAGPDGADCRPARPGEDPDVGLDLSALGSLYLGGFPASLLAAAGRIEELTPGGLRRADALLCGRPAPLSGTGF